MSFTNIEKLLKEAHEKLDKTEKHYNALDAKLDAVLLAGKSSKLTPVYSIVVLVLIFWVGTWF